MRVKRMNKVMQLKKTAGALSNKYLPQQNITDTSNVLMQTPKSGFDSSKAFTGSIAESADTVSTNSRQQAVTSSQVITGSIAAISSQASKPAFDSSKAFTGSIVERTYNLPTSGQDAFSSQSSSSQPSKPLSRFKMRRS
ncbi:hypothetical protein OIU79_001393 [Salix purpurea]|uniref:Uncharacterized protein n=1 Tax=Salix purpurea TaxID=77065 RepID=A0A9Q0UPW5_SALPP|nr:hypothetical protein OIU79_001393 [Salix purpurea]